MAEKTEEATPRRLRKAREEGDAGVSAYAAQAVGFVAAVALAASGVRALATYASGALREAIAAAAHASGARIAATRFDLPGTTFSVIALAAPVLLAAALTAGIASAVQSGGVLASKRLALRLERLDPVAGLAGVFSETRLFAVARSLVAGVVVAWLVWRGLADHLVDVARVGGRTQWLGVFVAQVGGALAWRAALVGVALGALDLLVTRTAWRARLRMTKDEVRREYRENEGDPQIKAARERAHQELLAQATIARVRTASVVVVNPTHLACALRYDEKDGDEAPVVVASGEGELARRIVREAERWGVPVVRDVPLARALVELQLEAGDVIPEALYEAVAEVLREVWEEGGR